MTKDVDKQHRFASFRIFIALQPGTRFPQNVFVILQVFKHFNRHDSIKCLGALEIVGIDIASVDCDIGETSGDGSRIYEDLLSGRVGEGRDSRVGVFLLEHSKSISIRLTWIGRSRRYAPWLEIRKANPIHIPYPGYPYRRPVEP